MIVMCGDEGIDGDEPVAAGTVVDDDRLAPFPAQPVGKQPGAGFRPQAEELTFAAQPGGDMRPYDRLIGAALSGQRWLFARQDTVENAWRVVDPVLK